METLETKYSLPFIGSGLTKKEIAELSENAIQAVLDEGNVIQVAEALSSMDEFTKQVRGDARFTEYVREELAKSSGKLQTASGAKIEAAEVGTTYDFTNCGDPVLIELEARAKAAKEELDARKDFLKTVSPKGMIVTDPESGETFTVYPPAKSSKSSYKISLAK
jgi:hypothetical protein